jgi:hypothetical protein
MIEIFPEKVPSKPRPKRPCTCTCRKGAELITVDPDVMAYTIASSLYEQAGMREQISMKTDYSYNVFQAAGWPKCHGVRKTTL